MHSAAYQGRADIVKALIAAGADLEHEETAAFLIRWRKQACAACGKSRQQDGVKLFACRGCGQQTGVRYCDSACARVHWVQHHHRRECEGLRNGLWTTLEEGA